jgi:hypothetical protein
MSLKAFWKCKRKISEMTQEEYLLDKLKRLDDVIDETRRQQCLTTITINRR